jgi:hypothetical protein
MVPVSAFVNSRESDSHVLEDRQKDEPRLLTETATEYKIVSFSKTPFKSIPLFLPNNVIYDPKTNTLSLDGDKQEETLVLCQEGRQLLQGVDKPISCVAAVGPYRTGKSLLLSRFLNDSKVFAVGPTLEGCTRGIWISTSCLLQGNKKKPYYTFLLDCQGTGDPVEGNDASNARIALTCILIASVFLFNNTGRPDRGSLQFLNYLDTIRKRIPTQGSFPDFPAFLWVFRDFFLQLPLRKDETPYTLKEYMVERVLQPQGAQDQVVDSLLNDFAAFDCLAAGYPRRADDHPFSAQELSMLDKMEWSEFSQDFQSDIQRVIAHSLASTRPFELGKVAAKGSQFASWCDQVLDLVNSESILPNIPDLQHRLLQSMADDAVDKAIGIYAKEMGEYLDACPVYNEKTSGSKKKKNKMEKKGNKAEVASTGDLQGVAEEKDLRTKSVSIVNRLSTELQTEIIAQSILKNSLSRLISSCVTGATSILSLMQENNKKRSKASCDRLARMLYSDFRALVRSDATSMSPETFESGAKYVETSFRAQARGPAVEETVQTFLKEQTEVDKVFLDKVHGINDLYQQTLEIKEKLDKDVKEKTELVGSLEKHLEVTTKEHQEEMERREAARKEEMENLMKAHTQAMKIEIAKQKAEEAAKLAALTAEFDRKEGEMDAFKRDAEKRLADEIAAREKRAKRNEEAHQEEIAKLLTVADETMKAEIMAAEAERKAQQKREEEEHKREIERLREEMEKKRQEEVERLEKARLEEREKHQKELDRLDSECNWCVTM